MVDNYARQRYASKELIILINHDEHNLDDYYRATRDDPNIRIASLPKETSLGACLNYAASLARYELIAKFDDDDYYAPNYLAESVDTLRRTDADIVGKRAHYMYLSGRSLLLLRYRRMENRPARQVQGATLLFKRRVLRKVRFQDVNRGECVRFCAEARASGYSIYSGSRYNFSAIRQEDRMAHTWKVRDRELLAKKVRKLKMTDFRAFVSR
ncbi:glycosyl transferase family 2 [Paenibacillus methanolicus]|uniref:Glycosyl transferase family 2 n=1 Tax=Paenibacillus methanolicus TaxID=582686 RepID=A0A5S5CMT6_9BACL|nr:glycosyl transferase family 2 [Paenibacillus methanolicus]